MPIEIKELHIKIKIEENEKVSETSMGLNKRDLEAMKSEIIKECTKKILEILKDKDDR
jgi:Family of unknown function (DUF5908)